jgi:hypothetical protein
MANFAEDTTDFLLTLLIECLYSKLCASDPSISPKELEGLSVSPNTAIENLPGILDESLKRSDILLPLYCDAFGLPQGSTCNQLAQKVRNLHENALGFAVAFFMAMEDYTNYLNVNTDNLTEPERTAYEADLETMRVELSLATSKHSQIFR